MTGCATEPPANGGPSDNVTTEGSSEGIAVDTLKGGDGDYAFGTERDDIATAVEAAFSTKNATARWDGDRLVLALDGDIDALMPGFKECRVLSHILLETDVASIEFPNGSVTCEEALAER